MNASEFVLEKTFALEKDTSVDTLEKTSHAPIALEQTEAEVASFWAHQHNPDVRELPRLGIG